MNPYVIPGLDRSKLKPAIVPGEIPSIGSGRKDIPIWHIHQRVCDYFDMPVSTNFHSRQVEEKNPRHWTMLFCKCLGYSYPQIAAYFEKKNAAPQHVVSKLMFEIEQYDNAMDTFRFFAREFAIKHHIDLLKKNKLKSWLIKVLSDQVTTPLKEKAQRTRPGRSSRPFGMKYPIKTGVMVSANQRTTITCALNCSKMPL